MVAGFRWGTLKYRPKDLVVGLRITLKFVLKFGWMIWNKFNSEWVSVVSCSANEKEPSGFIKYREF